MKTTILLGLWLAVGCTTPAKAQASKDTPTVEITTFRTVPNTAPEALAQAAKALNAHLENTPGFLHRTLVWDPEAQEWIDLVYWANPEAPRAVMESLMATPEAQAFFALIDPESVHMRLTQQIWTLGPPRTK